MKKSALGIVQEFADLRGLPRPNALIGSADKGARQFLALLNFLVRDLTRYSWSEQKRRKAFTALAAEDQGALTTIFGTDFQNLIPGTFWAGDKRMIVRGPVSDAEWQAMKTLQASGPEYSVYIAEGHLYINPIPSAGENFSAVYRTGEVILHDNVPSATIQSDTDTFLVPDDVIHAGLRFVWNKEKGEAWAEDYGYYIGLIAERREVNTNVPLQLDGMGVPARPGIVIPPGNWSV